MQLYLFNLSFGQLPLSGISTCYHTWRMKLPRVDMDRVDIDTGMMVPLCPKKWLIVNNLGTDHYFFPGGGIVISRRQEMFFHH